MARPPADCILFDHGNFMIVDTGLPHANMMHDAAQPYAVCQHVQGSMGRVVTKGRYRTLDLARRAVRRRVKHAERGA
jgi:hypothetical protein